VLAETVGRDPRVIERWEVKDLRRGRLECQLVVMGFEARIYGRTARRKTESVEAATFRNHLNGFPCICGILDSVIQKDVLDGNLLEQE